MTRNDRDHLDQIPSTDSKKRRILNLEFKEFVCSNSNLNEVIIKGLVDKIKELEPLMNSEGLKILELPFELFLNKILYLFVNTLNKVIWIYMLPFLLSDTTSSLDVSSKASKTCFGFGTRPRPCIWPGFSFPNILITILNKHHGRTIGFEKK
ncbi:hypothetical protein ACJX0J_033684 [Zea mays]